MSKINVQVAGVVLGKGGNCNVTIHARHEEEILTAVDAVLTEVRELRGEIAALPPHDGDGSRLGVNGWPLDRRS